MKEEKNITIPCSIAVERNNRTKSQGVRGYYDIVVYEGNGESNILSFHDRASKLLYVFTLLHPHGFQRRVLGRNNCSDLLALCSVLFGIKACGRIGTKLSNDFDHYISQAAAQSRRAVAESVKNPETAMNCSLADPRKTGGNLYIPRVKENVSCVMVDTRIKLYINNNH